MARSDEHPSGFVALKRLRADRLTAERLRERFLHECSLTLRLRHPNVVPTLQAGEIEGQPFATAELVRGQSGGAISRHLIEHPADAIAVVVRSVVDVLSALAYIHAAKEASGQPLGLVHRDVSPGNVLLGYDGRARLGDFGLAKSLFTEGRQLTEEGMVIGTPRYMPPEVAHGEAATPASDLYSLAALAYRLLSGRGPYEGSSNLEIFRTLSAGPPPPLKHAAPSVPAWLSAWVDRAMERDPNRRGSDAAAMRSELVSAADRAGLEYDAARVGRWLREHFAREQRAQERLLNQALSVRIDPFAPGPRTRVLSKPFPSLEIPAFSATAEATGVEEAATRPGRSRESGRPGPDSGAQTGVLTSPSPAGGRPLAEETAEESKSSLPMGMGAHRAALRPDLAPDVGDTARSPRPRAVGPTVESDIEPGPTRTSPALGWDVARSTGSGDVVVRSADLVPSGPRVPLWVVLVAVLLAGAAGGVVGAVVSMRLAPPDPPDASVKSGSRLPEEPR